MKTGLEVGTIMHEGRRWYAIDLLDGTLGLFKVRKHAEEFIFQQNCVFKWNRDDEDAA